jgi:hypothetical protein
MANTKKQPTKSRMNADLERIAREILSIETLETRNSDSLDFSEQAVCTLRRALEAAYQAGKAASLPALAAVKEIADTDGLGDDDTKSEKAYRLVCQGIADATGKPCAGLLGTFSPKADA